MAFKIDYCPAIDVVWGGWYCRRLFEAQQRLILYPPMLRVRHSSH